MFLQTSRNGICYVFQTTISHTVKLASGAALFPSAGEPGAYGTPGAPAEEPAAEGRVKLRLANFECLAA